MDSIFGEANKATEEMFDGQTSIDNVEETAEETSEVTTDETQHQNEIATSEENQEQASQEQIALAETARTAEVAAQAAADKEAELQQIRQQMEAERQRTENLENLVQELSRAREEEIIEDVLEPPSLDISSLAFADEETVKQAERKYADDLYNYNHKLFMKEFEPVIEQAKKAKMQEEKDKVVSQLSDVKELDGFKSMLPQLDYIIENNTVLASADIPLDEKYITAYAIARGVNSINQPPVVEKEPTVEELMEIYNKNQEFQEMVERQRIDQVKKSQQVPPFSASSGAVNAALTIQEEPSGWDEASKRTREMFK